MSVEYVTPNPIPPFTVRRMTRADGAEVVHIVARDGFSIIATVNQDRWGNAEKLAAAPDLVLALQRALLPHALSCGFYAQADDPSICCCGKSKFYHWKVAASEALAKLEPSAGKESK